MTDQSAYDNFDILIDRDSDNYRISITSAPGDRATEEPFLLPLDIAEIQALYKARKSLDPAALQALGTRLYQSLFHGRIMQVWAASRAIQNGRANSTAIRLRLRFGEGATELATLPWEILYDPIDAVFLAQQLPIVRYLAKETSTQDLRIEKPPLRLLAVMASPEIPGYAPLDLEKEWQLLQQTLSPLTQSGKLVLEQLTDPSRYGLQTRLMGEPVHILHFMGHGDYDRTTQQGVVILADGDQPQPVSASDFALLLHNHAHLRLVYLNACQSARGDTANIFAGTAQRLVKLGVPAAIAMQCI